MAIKLVDLFSGCGGMSLGFQNAGFKIVSAFDNWWPAIDIYKRNFDHPILQRDLSDDSVIEEIKALSPDIIIGGPPCQDFSIAGNRNFEGKRANLTLSYGKIIEIIKPKWFVMENVYNIEKSPVFEKVIDIFKKAGYGITKRVWDASFMGVPQMRRRYFVIGKLGEKDDFILDDLLAGLSEKPTTVRDYLGDKLGADYYYMHPRSYARRAIFSIDEPSSTIRGVNRPMPDTYKAHPADKTNDFSKVKNLSTKERSYLQTFPEWFDFVGSKADVEQTIGNAVPVKMAEYIARAIMNRISLESGSNATGTINDNNTHIALTPVERIKAKFKGFAWTNFKDVITDFLSTFGIAETTIKRIASRITDLSCGPIYIYRKAIVYCNVDSSANLFEQQCKSWIPGQIVISFTPDGVFWRDKDGNNGFTGYEHLYLNIDKFLPLITNELNQRDIYKTQDIGTLVSSLYRSLRLDGNTNETAITVVFNILYITLFPVESKKNEVENVINGSFQCYEDRILTLWESNKDNCYISHVDAIISKETFAYVKALLNNDMKGLDIEVLTSLVYKLLDDKDASLYGHQTSFTNVLKVINPLLLDRLRSNIKNANKEQLVRVANEILHLSCLDPTNSPGCFLSAAFMGLKDILSSIDDAIGTNYNEKLSVKQFVSVVDNIIAAELTKLTLTYCALSDNKKPVTIEMLKSIYSQLSIYIENALYVDWEKVLPYPEHTYIMGSPRFLGARKLKKEKQLRDAVYHAFGKEVGTVDYCSAWLIKSAKFIKSTNSKAAFVLTNSVVQGVQVADIWNDVFNEQCEIGFAYRSFKWKTADSGNVGVSVVIIGLQSTNEKEAKTLYLENKTVKCDKIGPYLLPNTDAIVRESDANLFGILPFIRKGNMAYDGSSKGPGKLLIETKNELNELLSDDPGSSKYIRRIVGSEEFINAVNRWCIWIPTEELPDDVHSMPAMLKRIENVRLYRATSTASQKCKDTPHRFRESFATSVGKQSIVIPSVSSENRPYIPVGFVSDKVIVSNLAFAVYDSDIWALAIISSRMHMLWIKTVCGALETRYRYSNTLGYNTFPVPYISDSNKEVLKELVYSLIDTRERHCDMSLGDLYNDMPEDLKKIHLLIDNTVDSLYRPYPFEDDNDRITHLINMYQSKLEI